MIFPIRRQGFRYYGSPMLQKEPTATWKVVCTFILPFAVIALVLCSVR
jgi:hypothetical protein